MEKPLPRARLEKPKVTTGIWLSFSFSRAFFSIMP